ncbi:hypothetical protein BC826DRAFT_525347 [Russula brevipes]|nr:hypothetical protein BC826DRAFT_525347 [Russula brevipes]
MAERYGSVKPLKPDCVGIFGNPPGTRKISWRAVEVVIEVKNRVEELVRQAATYARCVLASDRRRSFAVAIGFNHNTYEVSFSYCTALGSIDV